MAQRDGRRRARADRGGLQFKRFEQLEELQRALVGHHHDRGQQFGVRHPQEGDRFPVRLRDDQRRDRRGHLPRSPPGGDRRRRIRQQLPRRHQRAPDRDRQLHRRRHAGYRGAVRQPARGRSPARDPRRRRCRRARLGPDLRPRRPGLPRRFPVHPAARPIYARAGRAYLGGIPCTPVPETAPNSIQFWSVSVGDNAAAAVYAAKTLGIKSVALIYFNNAQGSSILPQITPVFKAAGVTTIHDIPLSPTSPDPSPQAALVESSGAQLAYVDVPNGCGNVLKALKSVGFTGKIMGIDPCSAPPVIAAAAGGAEGMYIASPFMLQSGNSQQAQLFEAAMKKWAAPGTLIDSISTAGFATVMNVQQVLSTISGTPTTASILAAFKTGTHQNFLSHPYTCNGQALKGATAICNDYYLMNQIQGGNVTQPDPAGWVTSKGYWPGLIRG